MRWASHKPFSRRSALQTVSSKKPISESVKEDSIPVISSPVQTKNRHSSEQTEHMHVSGRQKVKNQIIRHNSHNLSKFIDDRNENVSGIYTTRNLDNHKSKKYRAQQSQSLKEIVNLKQLHVYSSKELIGKNDHDAIRKTTRSSVDSNELRFKPRGDIIMGIYPVLLALKAERRSVYGIYYKKGKEIENEKIREILEIGQNRNITLHGTVVGEFKKVLNGEVHQGICCDASPLQYEELQEESLLVTGTENATKSYEFALDGLGHRHTHHQLWLYLDRIHDPMNFGAVLRSAYFMGVDRVLASSEHRFVSLQSCSLH